MHCLVMLRVWISFSRWALRIMLHFLIHLIKILGWWYWPQAIRECSCTRIWNSRGKLLSSICFFHWKGTATRNLFINFIHVFRLTRYGIGIVFSQKYHRNYALNGNKPNHWQQATKIEQLCVKSSWTDTWHAIRFP